jgi:cell fate (sporulation/competence/biofilm development) regulator YmcA (YheA/YmcA/DUF963 family)
MQEKTQLALNKIKQEIQAFDYVQDFQKAEAKLKADNAIFEQQETMKALQKDAVLYQKIGKNEAYRGTMREAQRLEKTLKNDVAVQDYALKMEPVNGLLEHLTSEIERKVNEKLEML